jgi:hypothetical protein
VISIPILVRFYSPFPHPWVICCISIRFPLFVTCRWLFQLSTIIWFNRWFSIIFSIIRYCVIDWDSFSVACFSFVLNDHWFWIPIYTYPGSFYKDDDARLGQTTQGGVSSVSSVRTQPNSSFAGGRSVGGVSGLGSSLGSYTTSNTSTQRSVGGVLGSAGVPGSNTGVYDRSRGRSPYRWIAIWKTWLFFDLVELYMYWMEVDFWNKKKRDDDDDDHHDKQTWSCSNAYLCLYSLSLIFFFCASLSIVVNFSLCSLLMLVDIQEETDFIETNNLKINVLLIFEFQKQTEAKKIFVFENIFVS